MLILPHNQLLLFMTSDCNVELTLNDVLDDIRYPPRCTCP